MKATCACALIMHNNLVLGVTRRHTVDQWGLPGGKCEPNETALECSRRELLEETGILSIYTPTLEYVGPIDGTYCATYRHTYIPKRFKPEPGLLVAWITWAELFKGPFATYNVDLYRTLCARSVV